MPNARMALVLPVAMTLLGCHGIIEDSNSSSPGVAGNSSTGQPTDMDGDGKPEPPVTTPEGQMCDAAFYGSAAPLRLLTNLELRNTLQDLLALEMDPTADFPPDTPPHGFDNNAAQSGYSQLRVRRMFDAAERAAVAYAQNPRDLECSVDAIDQACLDKLYDKLGRRAYRRAPTAAERAALSAVWQGLGPDFTPSERLAAVVQTMLMTFQLNFRPEVGDSALPAPAPGYVALSGSEMATRLSYALWSTLPDDALLAAAEAGKLASAEGVREQAGRLLADPRARRSLGNFADQWLGTRRLPSKPDKDPEWFPSYTPELVSAMRRETETFFADAVLRGPGGLDQLLTGTSSTINGALAALYGVPAPESADGWGTVSLPASQRMGMLTLPGFLAVHAQNRLPSPVTRGLFVLTELRCKTIQAPPAGATSMGAMPTDPAPTNRQIKEAHSSNPSCKGCHTLIDPPGYAFEIYDAIGAYQETERVADGSRKPVDATATVVGTDFDGTYHDALEMIPALAKSEEVRSCVAKQLFRYTHGRLESAADACNLALLSSALERSEGDVSELLVNLLSAAPFRARPVDG